MRDGKDCIRPFFGWRLDVKMFQTCESQERQDVVEQKRGAKGMIGRIEGRAETVLGRMKDDGKEE